jgi:acetyltransferase-like isoleucine patch superfamily enzyme
MLLLNWIAQRQAKSKYCVKGNNSILYPESEIANAQLDKSKIIIGSNSHVRGQLLVFNHGGKIEIGDWCFVGRNSYIWSAINIKIGNRVLISHNCTVLDNDTHPINPVDRHLHFSKIVTGGHPKDINLLEEEVIIEDDVLIGTGCIILKGVRIGRGAIIGAGSIVTQNVKSFTIVAGNPAKKIRDIYPEDNE